MKVYKNTVHTEPEYSKRIVRYILTGIIIATSSAFVACDSSNSESTTAEAETQDSATLATNVKMATKMLQAAIQSGQWDVKLLDNMCKRLAAIEARMAIDSASLKADANLGQIILEADKTVSQIEINDKTSSIEGFKEKRTQAKDSLSRIKSGLGIQQGVTEDDLVEKVSQVAESLKQASKDRKMSVGVLNKVAEVTKEVGTAISKGDVEIGPDIANAIVSLDMLLSNVAGQAGGEANLRTAWSNADKALSQIQVALGIQSEAAEDVAAASREVQDEEDATVKFNTPLATKSNTQQTKPITTVQSTSPSVKAGISKNGIKTRYGTHDYGCKTQAEYDQAMAILDKVMANDSYINKNSIAWQMHRAYAEGTRYTVYQKGTTEYSILYKKEKSQGFFFSVTNPKHYDVAFKASAISSKLTEGTRNPGDGTPRSLYDVLVRKVTDCDSDAQLKSAIFDKMGYNTKVMASTNHAWPLAQIDGKWWNVEGGTFNPANPNGGQQMSGETFK